MAIKTCSGQTNVLIFSVADYFLHSVLVLFFDLPQYRRYPGFLLSAQNIHSLRLTLQFRRGTDKLKAA